MFAAKIHSSEVMPKVMLLKKNQWFCFYSLLCDKFQIKNLELSKMISLKLSHSKKPTYKKTTYRKKPITLK